MNRRRMIPVMMPYRSDIFRRGVVDNGDNSEQLPIINNQKQSSLILQ
jgi:hypothetical protein